MPTTLTTTEASSVREAAREQGWNEVVLKPLVSAGGRHVRRATVDALPVLPAAADGQPEGWLVQPLLRGIAAGEYSCVFVAGTLTHTVLKRASGTEFRVQASYGGRTTVVQPPAQVRETAELAVEVLASGHVYARVDVVVDPVFGAVVMEVEMVEPDLFLRLADDAAGLLADAVLARVGEQQ